MVALSRNALLFFYFVASCCSTRTSYFREHNKKEHVETRRRHRKEHIKSMVIPNNFPELRSDSSFGVHVEGVTGDNATVVMAAADNFDQLVQWYVVAYWVKRQRAMWHERFGGANGDKSRVLIDKLLPGNKYEVRVTALLSDGTNEQAVANFSTPGDPHSGRNRPPADGFPRNKSKERCSLDITNRTTYSSGTLNLKFPRYPCKGQKLDRYAIVYKSKHDYLAVYLSNNESDIVIEGLIKEPVDVWVKELKMNESAAAGFSFLPTVPETDNGSEMDSLRNMDDLPGSSSGPLSRNLIPLNVIPSDQTLSKVPTPSPFGLFYAPTVTTTTTTTNGLLISVIILSVLFVSSAFVAIYLCVYLRVHRHEIAENRRLRDSINAKPKIVLTTKDLKHSCSEKKVALDESASLDKISVQNVSVDLAVKITTL